MNKKEPVPAYEAGTEQRIAQRTLAARHINLVGGRQCA